MRRQWPLSLLILGLALSGCQSVSTPGGSDAARSSTGTVRSGPCLSGGAPAWVASSRSLPRPGDSRLYGSGQAANDQRAADMDARVQLLTTLESHITGTLNVVEQETSATGYAYAVTSTSGQTVTMRISGLDVEDRWVDSSCGTYYALARLDTKRAVDAWALELQAVERKAKAERARADRLLQGGDLITALLALHMLRDLQQAAAPLVLRATYVNRQYVSPAERAPLPEIGEETGTRHELESLLASVQLRKERGDLQRGQAGEPLAAPLEVRLVYRGSGQERPVTQARVEFAFAAGQGALDRHSVTDQQGLARTKVQRVAPSTQPAEVVARVALADMTGGFPLALQQQLQQSLGKQDVRFTLTPPPPRSPLEEQLERLARSIADSSNESQGKPVRLDEFMEAHSGQRHGIGVVLKEGLARAFAHIQWGPRVVSLSGLPAAGASPAKEPEAISVFAVIEGRYRFLRDDTVEVSAKLKRLMDGSQLEVPETVNIPRAVFNAGELEQLPPPRVGGDAEPIMHPPVVTQSNKDWIEEQWLSSNSKGFKTSLQPERPVYQVGERMRFQFRTDEDCYLTVFNIGTSGRLIRLLPSAYEPMERLVRKGTEWMTIPGPEDPFDFTVNPPLGTERVIAFCTKTRVRLIENAHEKDGFWRLDSADGSKTRDLRPTGKVFKPEDWSVARARADTVTGGQRETRGLTERRTRGLIE